MRKVLTITTILAASTLLADAANMQLTNVVCRVRFSDQTAVEWINDTDALETLMNSESSDDNSVWRYFNDTSYGALSWKSHIVDIEYKDTHPRGYYCPKSDSNPDGYTMIIQGYMREQTLIKELCASIAPDMTDGLILDGNNDWEVDNLMVVFAGNSDPNSSTLLWPHQNTMTWAAAAIGVYDIKNYLIVFDGVNGAHQLNPGVMCHEMCHALGAYDLYSNGNLEPVGKWDLMSDNQPVPQGMTAYMRYEYGRKWGNWIPEIKTLDTPGTYTLKPIYSDAPEDVAYIIKPDASRHEYFMVEYRRKTGWDASIPSSGLICYRINPDVSSNLASTKHELYIFRPNGSLTSKGSLDKANFNASVRRTQFGIDDTYYPFYSDGSRADFALTEIGKAEDEGITFTLSFPSNGIAGMTADGHDLTYDQYTQSITTCPSSIIEVYSISGELVSKGYGEISISHLPKGIYISRSASHTLKIYKTR